MNPEWSNIINIIVNFEILVIEFSKIKKYIK